MSLNEKVSCINNLPRSGAIAFVGREDDLKALHEQLQQETTVAISAISGMGGIGKTELAWQYADQQRQAGTYPGGICWLSARNDLGTQIVSFARSQLNLPIPDNLELLEKVTWCWRQWHEKETLIVFDDVQKFEDVQALLPPTRSQFQILLTTRSRLAYPVQNFEIKVLSEPAALDLLRMIVRDGRIDQALHIAKQICEWLGYLPLGLVSIAQYLASEEDWSLAKLAQSLRLEIQVEKEGVTNISLLDRINGEKNKVSETWFPQKRQVIYQDSYRHRTCLRKLRDLEEIQQLGQVEIEIIKELKMKIISEHIDSLHQDPPSDKV